MHHLPTLGAQKLHQNLTCGEMKKEKLKLKNSGYKKEMVKLDTDQLSSITKTISHRASWRDG